MADTGRDHEPQEGEAKKRVRKKCEHGRQKNLCKECGGSSICEHGRNKSLCKECGGSSICEHGRQKYYCKGCGGSAFCEHRRIKRQCKECGGSAFCEHGRRRSTCKECGGSAFCEHGRQKSRCKECGGASICEHGRIKNYCKECGGSEICEHGRQKSLCKECLPIDKLVSSKYFCIVCFTLLSKKRQRANSRMCAGCEATCPRTEEIVRKLLLERLSEFPPSSIDDHSDMLGGAACQQERKARPDIAWHTERATVIFECDEDSHSSPSYCDAYTPARSSALAEAVHRVRGKLVPVFIVGMNPDAYDGARVKFENRVKCAANLVRSLLTHPCPEEEFDPRVPHVWLLYYHSKSERHVNACREAHARGQLFFHESEEITSSEPDEYSDEEMDESEVDE